MSQVQTWLQQGNKEHVWESLCRSSGCSTCTIKTTERLWHRKIVEVKDIIAVHNSNSWSWCRFSQRISTAFWFLLLALFDFGSQWSVPSVPRRTVNPWKAPPYGAVASGVAVAWSGAQQLGPIQSFTLGATSRDVALCYILLHDVTWYRHNQTLIRFN